jgi:16S rRNA (uracil1498-N3)-methyltransferase
MPSGPETGHRVFHLAPPWPGPGGEAVLSAGESRHALRVLRLAPGDALQVIDAAGQQAEAVVIGARGGRLRVRLGPAGPCSGEARLVGRVGLPRLRSVARMDWAVEKATELGAAAFEVYGADRSLKGVARAGEGRCKRWERVALAAMKQSGRALAPPVRVHADLTALLEVLPGARLLAADPLGAVQPPGDWLAQAAGERVLLVGPEGGWSEREERLLDERGAARVALGPRRLRAETAALPRAARGESNTKELGCRGSRESST